MFGIDGTELIVLIIIVAIILGPEQLPGVARSLSKFVREITKARDEFKKSVDDDPSLREIKQNLREVKTDIESQVNDVTHGVKTDLDKLKAVLLESYYLYVMQQS